MKVQSLDQSRRELIIAVFITILASYYIDLFLKIGNLTAPIDVNVVRLMMLGTGMGFYALIKTRQAFIFQYAVIMAVVIGARLIEPVILETNLVGDLFDLGSFTGLFASNVLVKLLGATLVILALQLFFKTKQKTYLGIGDLSVKVSKIDWLGIREGSINWGRLSIISGLLISLGTILLTLITVIGSGAVVKTEFLVRMIPSILILAALNSFCEGIVFRNAVIAPLGNHLPKETVIYLSALLFGSFHYVGAPGGIIGVVMSTVLGWYIARSVYETKGMLAGWIIHFMQDVVIFSTLALLGGFVS